MLSNRIHDYDRAVGARVRQMRQALSYSQGKLAAACGVTFQQIQKYENGSNRISAGRLIQIARVLDVPVARIFEGIGDETPADGRS